MLMEVMVLLNTFSMKEFEKLVGEQEISPLNILGLAIGLEQIVAKFKDLKGKQKKDLVIRVIEQYLLDHGGDKYDALLFLPSFIDVSIGLDHRDIEIDVDQVAMGCCALLFAPRKHLKKKN